MISKVYYLYSKQDELSEEDLEIVERTYNERELRRQTLDFCRQCVVRILKDTGDYDYVALKESDIEFAQDAVFFCGKHCARQFLKEQKRILGHIDYWKPIPVHQWDMSMKEDFEERHCIEVKPNKGREAHIDLIIDSIYERVESRTDTSNL